MSTRLREFFDKVELTTFFHQEPPLKEGGKERFRLKILQCRVSVESQSNGEFSANVLRMDFNRYKTKNHLLSNRKVAVRKGEIFLRRRLCTVLRHCWAIPRYFFSAPHSCKLGRAFRVGFGLKFTKISGLFRA